MSNYNIQISWSGKDALSDSDPLKVISGTDFQTEFEAVRTAINSKAETVDILSSVYPVGSIYINATNSTNPASLLGFGTWTAFGAGRVPVGFDASDSDFNTAEETGGAKTATTTGTVTVDGHALTEAEMPKHYHQYRAANSMTAPQNGGGTGNGGIYGGGTPDDGAWGYGTWSTGGGATSGSLSTGTGNGSAHSHTASLSSTSTSTVQPYITVYMWKRTA